MSRPKMLGAHTPDARRDANGFTVKRRVMPVRAKVITDAANRWLRDRDVLFRMHVGGFQKT